MLARGLAKMVDKEDTFLFIPFLFVSFFDINIRVKRINKKFIN